LIYWNENGLEFNEHNKIWLSNYLFINSYDMSFSERESIEKWLNEYLNKSEDFDIEKGRKGVAIGTISDDGKRIKKLNGWEYIKNDKHKSEKEVNKIKEDNYNPKIFERPEMENPVYSITVNSKDYFLQRTDFNG